MTFAWRPDGKPPDDEYDPFSDLPTDLGEPSKPYVFTDPSGALLPDDHPGWGNEEKS